MVAFANNRTHNTPAGSRPMIDEAAARAAAGRLLSDLQTIAAEYLAAIRAGLPQPNAFNAVRRAFADGWGLPPARAACWARIVVALAGAAVHEQVYARQDLEMIVRRALGDA